MQPWQDGISPFKPKSVLIRVKQVGLLINIDRTDVKTMFPEDQPVTGSQHVLVVIIGKPPHTVLIVGQGFRKDNPPFVTTTRVQQRTGVSRTHVHTQFTVSGLDRQTWKQKQYRQIFTITQ